MVNHVLPDISENLNDVSVDELEGELRGIVGVELQTLLHQLLVGEAGDPRRLTSRR